MAKIRKPAKRAKRFEAMMLHASGWYILWTDATKDGPFKTIGDAIKAYPLPEKEIVEAYFGKAN